MDRRGVLRALASLAATATVVACGSSDAASPDPPSTLGDVGQLPATIAAAATVPSTEPSDSVDRPVETTDRPARPETDPAPEPVNDGRRTIGRLVAGNRVIVIGDSILASISNRYGNQLCDELVPRGWAVEVDAEVGRFIGFGREVLEEQRDEDWDAAVVMLGNNYDGNPQAFADELDLLLDELEPLPVLLLNVTRFEAAQDEVNWILTGEANQRDDVAVLDWASRTADDAPGSDELLTGDGLHLTTRGQEALASLIGRAMGRAPAGSEGACLRSSFRDDTDGTLPRESERSSNEGRGDDSDDERRDPSDGVRRDDPGGGGGDGAPTGRAVTTTSPPPAVEPPVTVVRPTPTAPADGPEDAPPVTTGET